MVAGIASIGMTSTRPAQASRDLAQARSAFDLRDEEASRAAHNADALVAKNTEKHPKMGGHIKSIVYGGLDGIITTFAVVAGAAGGGLGPNVVIVMGVSSLLADALSMGVGDALSSKAEKEVAVREREREKWELENFKEGEIKEMVEIYTGRGMSQQDAELVIRVCAKYEELFVDMMLVDELGIEPPGDGDNPWKARLQRPASTGRRPASGAQQCVRVRAGRRGHLWLLLLLRLLPAGGVLRLWLPRARPARSLCHLMRPHRRHALHPWCAAAAAPPHLTHGHELCAAPLGVCAELRARVRHPRPGALKSTMTTRSWWVSGFEVLAVGVLVAGVAFAIGVLIEDMLLSSGTSMGGVH